MNSNQTRRLSWAQAASVSLNDRKERWVAKILRRQVQADSRKSWYMDPVREFVSRRTQGKNLEKNGSIADLHLPPDRATIKFDNLPLDIHLDIMDFLDKNDLLSLRLLNHRLSDVVSTALFRSLKLVYLASTQNNYQVCQTHGVYDGTAAPCYPPSPEQCGYYKSAVWQTMIGTRKMDFISAPLVMQAQKEPGHVLFRYTREFVIVFSSNWYAAHGADRKGLLVTFAELGLPAVLDAMTLLRAVRVFVRPWLDGKERSKAIESFSKAICSHCAKRNLSLHISVKVGNNRLAKWSAAVDFVKSLNGLTSLKLAMPASLYIHDWREPEEVRGERLEHDTGRELFEAEVASLIERSPLLKKEANWSKPARRIAASSMLHWLPRPKAARLRYLLGDPQTVLVDHDELKMRDISLPYSHVVK